MQFPQNIEAWDGKRIDVRCWLPAAGPRAVVHLLHGLGEHSDRYERFAAAATEAGLAVVAHDHRGHGTGSDSATYGHFADSGGWDTVLADVESVQREIRARSNGLPTILFGHSMGSYIAQHFVMKHAENIAMLILSGSTYADRGQLRAGHLFAGLLGTFSGWRRRSALLDRMGFGAFNRRFEPARTKYDWLSRDAAEVDRYIADPHCGGPFTNRLWYDLTGGLLAITSRDAVQRVPLSLPILIFGGADDPVGGAKGQSRLAAVYTDSGHTDVTLEIYDGGRHEMLNETNRDDVTRDVLAWINARL